MSKPEKNLVRPSEAARTIGITTQTLHAWRRRGYVVAIALPNGRFGIPTEEVTRLRGAR